MLFFFSIVLATKNVGSFTKNGFHPHKMVFIKNNTALLCITMRKHTRTFEYTIYCITFWYSFCHCKDQFLWCTFGMGTRNFQKVVLRMKLFLSLLSFTCYTVNIGVWKYVFICVVIKIKVFYLCRTRVIRVALVSYSCHIRVALVFLVSIVLHSCH